MNVYHRIRFRNALIGMAPALADFVLYLRFAFKLYGKLGEGWPIAPFNLVKRAIIRREGRRLGAKCLVETGTYLGDTTWYLRKNFERIITVEVEPRLAAIARDRFRNWKNISVIEGDSGDELVRIVPTLTAPTVFWLDGHYSAGITGRGATDCPIWKELAAIASRPDLKCSILIDDAGDFGRDPAYPQIDELRAWCQTTLPQYDFNIENNIIMMAIGDHVAMHSATSKT